MDDDNRHHQSSMSSLAREDGTISNNASSVSTKTRDHQTTIGYNYHNQDILSKLDLPPATLEALKTLSSLGMDNLTDCDRLTASLEQIRAKKNMKLFEKLDKIRQDFSGLNQKLAKMEESILNLKQVTYDFNCNLKSDDNSSEKLQ